MVQFNSMQKNREGMRAGARLTRRRLVALGVGGAAAAFEARGAAAVQSGVALLDANAYDAYVPAALKEGQFAQYTCEFDAAWAVLKTFEIDTNLEQQVAIVGVDRRIEP